MNLPVKNYKTKNCVFQRIRVGKLSNCLYIVKYINQNEEVIYNQTDYIFKAIYILLVLTNYFDSHHFCPWFFEIIFMNIPLVRHIGYYVLCDHKLQNIIVWVVLCFIFLKPWIQLSLYLWGISKTLKRSLLNTTNHFSFFLDINLWFHNYVWIFCQNYYRNYQATRGHTIRHSEKTYCRSTGVWLKGISSQSCVEQCSRGLFI